jgi:hypothetical protein
MTRASLRTAAATAAWIGGCVARHRPALEEAAGWLSGRPARRTLTLAHDELAAPCRTAVPARSSARASLRASEVRPLCSRLCRVPVLDGTELQAALRLSAPRCRATVGRYLSNDAIDC